MQTIGRPLVWGVNPELTPEIIGNVPEGGRVFEIMQIANSLAVAHVETETETFACNIEHSDEHGFVLALDMIKWRFATPSPPPGPMRRLFAWLQRLFR